MANIVRNPYSNTAGNAPTSLVDGQIAVNQSDGRFFYRSSAGAVATFSPIASFASVGSFPASGAANILYLAQDSSRVYQWNGGAYIEVGVASGYILPNATTSSLGGIVVGAGLSVASGTVSANVVSVAGRTGAVTISSGDVSGLPTAGTGSANYCAGDDSRLSDARSPTSHQHAASDITSGTIATSRLASGTPDSTTYLRGDQTWASFSVADGSITSAKLADPFVYDCGAYSALAPAAPTGISGTPGVGSVALSWTAPSNTGGVSLTDYAVQYSTDQSNWTNFADGTSTATTATVTGLQGGTNYFFRVAAVNSIGTGAYVTSTAIAPSASKISISRTNGTSTFSGAGTAGSPYVRATEVLASNADAITYYRFTASASCTVSYTITGIDAGINGEYLSVRKNGTQVALLDYNGYDGAGIARSGSLSLASGDVLSFSPSYTSSAFKNVSVSAA